ncbi:MAG: glucose-6-phosphate isomerase [Gammaproteobacteria bacterium]|nr:glucose-6-phosphate isomerase [Gammaproteobacteria bacterium]
MTGFFLLHDNPPQQTEAWRQLAEHGRRMAGLCMKEEFAQDPGRAQRFSLGLEQLFVDFSKNLITDETLSLLLRLAQQRGLSERIEVLFSGHEVNTTERRPALHTLLRVPESQGEVSPSPDSGLARNANPCLHKQGSSLAGDELPDIIRQTQHERERMFEFARALRAGEVAGAAGKPLSRVVNIGIGGSDLGPRLLVEALSDGQQDGADIDFVANIDPADIERALARAEPETTLFIVASKSFTTTETLVNARRAWAWLHDNGCTHPGRHFLAVSGNAAAVARFGIAKDRYFRIEDWTGGRYSIWSCIGISAALSIGAERYRQFLAGAHALDRHFATAKFAENIPVLLGLISIWHNNFLDIGTHAIIPYDQGLERLPAYLSQLVMESNGKSVNAAGDKVGIRTTPVLWGGVGSQVQHAVFQYLYQGTRLASIDFLLPLSSRHNQAQHQLLVANCLAQGEALMRGNPDAAEPHRRFDGNRPSTTILYQRLDPYTLGMLLALYEHKTFVEAALWGINPFDQWGVELGKTLAGQIATGLSGAAPAGSHDSSTEQLLDRYSLAQMK